MFSAKVSSTGIVSDESTDWINGSCTTSTGSQNFSTACNFNSDIFKISPNCSFSIKKEFPWTSGVQSVTSTSIAYTVSNSGSGSSGVDAYLVCQKAGNDYLNSRITQQIVQMRGVPTVPGATGGIDTFSVSYGTTNATTVCSASPCSYLDQIGGAVTSVTRAGVGNYTLNTVKTYSKLKCTMSAANAAQYLAGNVNPGSCSNCSSIAFSTGYTTTAAYRDWETDRKSTRLNSSHSGESRMPSSA